jgi:hypothetical protein
MKVTEHLKKANGKTLLNKEVLTPFKVENIRTIIEKMEKLM